MNRQAAFLEIVVVLLMPVRGHFHELCQALRRTCRVVHEDKTDNNNGAFDSRCRDVGKNVAISGLLSRLLQLTVEASLGVAPSLVSVPHFFACFVSH